MRGKSISFEVFRFRAFFFLTHRLGTAYPAPYPSPLHRSPASPVTASPRPDVSPKAYPTFNGQIRVGFYQDTVSTKSSPDKSSCSPRDNNPYNQYPPSYGNPYCSHPSYSGASPTPPYNSEGSPAMYDGKTGGYPAGRGYEGSEGSSPASQRHSPTMEIVQQVSGGFERVLFCQCRIVIEQSKLKHS